jgi:hypothetical protein
VSCIGYAVFFGWLCQKTRLAGPPVESSWCVCVCGGIPVRVPREQLFWRRA